MATFQPTNAIHYPKAADSQSLHPDVIVAYGVAFVDRIRLLVVPAEGPAQEARVVRHSGEEAVCCGTPHWAAVLTDLTNGFLTGASMRMTTASTSSRRRGQICMPSTAGTSTSTASSCSTGKRVADQRIDTRGISGHLVVRRQNR